LEDLYSAQVFSIDILAVIMIVKQHLIKVFGLLTSTKLLTLSLASAHISLAHVTIADCCLIMTGSCIIKGLMTTS
jgi:uncharacterized membrane protein